MVRSRGARLASPGGKAHRRAMRTLRTASALPGPRALAGPPPLRGAGRRLAWGQSIYAASTVTGRRLESEGAWGSTARGRRGRAANQNWGLGGRGGAPAWPSLI